MTVLAPDMDGRELDAWAVAHEVADVLPESITRVVSYEVAGLAWYDGPSIRNVIVNVDPHAVRRGALKPWPRHLQEAVIDAVKAIAVNTARWVALEREARAWRDAPPEQLALRIAWGELQNRRLSVRARVPPRGWHADTTVELATDPPALIARPSARLAARARVVLGFDPPHLSELPEPPIVQLAVIDRLLDALTSPQDEALRASLSKVLEQPRWQRDLEALRRIAAPPPLPEEDDKPNLAWRLTADGSGSLGIAPARARAKKTGGGFVVKQIKPAEIPAALLVDPVDAAVAEALTLWRDPPSAVVLELLEQLVGHPRVLPPGRSGEPVSVTRSRLTVHVGVREDGLARLELALDGSPLAPAEVRAALAAGNVAGGRMAVARPDGVYVARVRRAALAQLEGWLAREAAFPAAAQSALLEVAQELSGQVSVSVEPSLRGARLEGDPRPLLQLRWDEPDRSVDHGLGVESLRVAARVRPAPELPALVPGEGSSELFVQRGARRFCVERDLDTEAARVRAALAPLGIPERAEQGPFAWRLADPQQALALVERLQARRNEFQLEWSGGVPRVAGEITARSLRLGVGQGRDWFELRGSVQLTEGKAELVDLLRAVGKGDAYIQIAAGTFAKLDRGLRSRLVALSDGVDAAEPRVSPLQAPLLAGLKEDGAELAVPASWWTQMQRLDEARHLEVAVPAGLRATLRDYQEVGFRWLAALAHWAPGACLADDMGLGKTLQATALLLHRAALGPALVVAPTSVLFNWQRELARFAPELRVRVHHGGSRDRSLQDLAPGDVVLTTWGVCTRDTEALSAAAFATAVLDEAQAIKNPATRRAEAAAALKADFRVALSGTPVENRTLELWSLFRVVAPGLLGPLHRFQERFVTPIEVRHDSSRREALAARIRPFVLRRTKEQVERSLPALTESVLTVQLSEPERALYDTTRTRARERILGAEEGRRGFRVLQELTLLRQLACHPRLVDAGSSVPSSKLKVLRRLIADLRENGHRALVFSQFVRHLELAREALAADGVRMRWLDGSTPLAARRAEVDAFQSGDGDVFLISLDAGGVGLNLTGANYVVHLDPWWNPAREDQATDRAHRIGQERAVHVYRLVSQGTIEEKILALHGEKRALAEALLAGTDGPFRPSTEELVALLADPDEPPVGRPAPPPASIDPGQSGLG